MFDAFVLDVTPACVVGHSVTSSCVTGLVQLDENPGQDTHYLAYEDQASSMITPLRKGSCRSCASVLDINSATQWNQ